MAPHSSKIPWTQEPGRLQSTGGGGCQKAEDMTPVTAQKVEGFPGGTESSQVVKNLPPRWQRILLPV